MPNCRIATATKQGGQTGGLMTGRALFLQTLAVTIALLPTMGCVSALYLARGGACPVGRKTCQEENIFEATSWHESVVTEKVETRLETEVTSFDLKGSVSAKQATIHVSTNYRCRRVTETPRELKRSVKRRWQHDEKDDSFKWAWIGDVFATASLYYLGSIDYDKPKVVDLDTGAESYQFRDIPRPLFVGLVGMLAVDGVVSFLGARDSVQRKKLSPVIEFDEWATCDGPSASPGLTARISLRHFDGVEIPLGEAPVNAESTATVMLPSEVALSFDRHGAGEFVAQLLDRRSSNRDAVHTYRKAPKYGSPARGRVRPVAEWSASLRSASVLASSALRCQDFAECACAGAALVFKKKRPMAEANFVDWRGSDYLAKDHVFIEDILAIEHAFDQNRSTCGQDKHSALTSEFRGMLEKFVEQDRSASQAALPILVSRVTCLAQVVQKVKAVASAGAAARSNLLQSQMFMQQLLDRATQERDKREVECEKAFTTLDAAKSLSAFAHQLSEVGVSLASDRCEGAESIRARKSSYLQRISRWLVDDLRGSYVTCLSTELQQLKRMPRPGVGKSSGARTLPQECKDILQTTREATALEAVVSLAASRWDAQLGAVTRLLDSTVTALTEDALMDQVTANETKAEAMSASSSSSEAAPAQPPSTRAFAAWPDVARLVRARDEEKKRVIERSWKVVRKALPAVCRKAMTTAKVGFVTKCRTVGIEEKLVCVCGYRTYAGDYREEKKFGFCSWAQETKSCFKAHVPRKHCGKRYSKTRFDLAVECCTMELDYHISEATPNLVTSLVENDIKINFSQLGLDPSHFGSQVESCIKNPDYYRSGKAFHGCGGDEPDESSEEDSD